MKDEARQRNRGARDVPRVNAQQCAGCGACAKVCFRRAISFAEGDKADIVRKRCAGMDDCGRCADACGNNAIEDGR
ncbi:MAG: 4Fe-4S binding protein [Spirochaetaceae bacterium]|jgi:MinD superfamily P-loop ATPase|nr:4Fe-4S binding protein [Spirochaetaceae bacterium]